MYGKQGLAKGLRWAARVIGLYMTLSLLFSSVLAGFKEGFGELEYSMTFVTVIPLAGCIISWWRQRLAGALLILTWAAIGVLLVTTGKPILDAFLNESLIFIIVGVLFLVSWWLSRKTSPSALPPSPTS